MSQGRPMRWGTNDVYIAVSLAFRADDHLGFMHEESLTNTQTVFVILFVNILECGQRVSCCEYVHI